MKAAIGNGQVRDTLFKSTSVEITDLGGQRRFAIIGGDPARERLLTALGECNRINTAAPITIKEEQTSSGFGWILLIQAAPFVLFFGFWAATLGVIVWALLTISGNKG